MGQTCFIIFKLVIGGMISERMGILWTGLEKVVVYGIGFLQGIVLARLLMPADFGLAAMLGIFTGIGGVLAESGLGTALVVKASGRGIASDRAALKWNVGVALSLACAFTAASPFVARWYGAQILAPLLATLSAAMVVNAAGVSAAARLTRLQMFDKLAAANVAQTLLGALAAIGMALAGFGVWSIAGLVMAQSVARTSVLWWLAWPRRDEPESAETHLRELLGYGWKLTASGMVHSAYCNLYSLLIGKLWSPAAVGLFTRGERWARLPGELVNESVGRVALPKFVSGECSARRMVLENALLLWPLLGALWLSSGPIVNVVLGEQWLSCIPYIKILIVGQLFTPFTNVALNALKSDGRTDLVLVSDAIKKPVGILALLTGCLFGMEGVCWAKVVSDVAECVTDVLFVLWERRKIPDVDLVYCWCNGPDFDVREKCRFCNNEELRYSIRSADAFAKWVRRIYVFVNDGTVIPEWLAAHRKVVVVRHSEVIPKNVLPLYNSVSIEFWLHRLPGLSERFIYGNDDMFFGRSVSPSDFFDLRGRMICRYKLGVSLHAALAADGGAYNSQLLNCRRLLEVCDDSLPHHSFDGYLKSVIEDFWRKYPEEALRSGSFRERSAEQLIRDVFSLYAVKTGRGVRGKVRRWRLRWDSLYAELCDRAAMDRIRRMRPKMFCLNDSERCSDEDRRAATDFLEKMYGQ